MRLGLCSFPVLLVASASALTGCALFDRGSSLEEAFEYLPADTYQVQFSDRAAMAERRDLDDLDARDLSDQDVEDYIEEGYLDHLEEALPVSELGKRLHAMKDAPINELDVRWEARATWGDDPVERSGTAILWKVGDDLDFDDLADDLEDKGYEASDTNGLPVYSADPADTDPETGLVGGTYPYSMLNVLLDEDEQIVAAAPSADSLTDIAEVVADDAESLADDGGMDALADLAADEPEIALLSTDGPTVCRDLGILVPPEVRARYRDLGRPEGRALFVTGGEPTVLLALQYSSEEAAKDDLEARRALLEDGQDARTAEPFAAIGDFAVERDGAVLQIHADYEEGSAEALTAETNGSGPGICLPDRRITPRA